MGNKVKVTFMEDFRLKAVHNPGASHFELSLKNPDNTDYLFLTVSNSMYHSNEITTRASCESFYLKDKLNSSMKRILMIGSLHKAFRESEVFKNNNICLSSWQTIEKTDIPFYGFTGFYMYFKFLIRKDKIQIGHVTTNHEIDYNFDAVKREANIKIDELNAVEEVVDKANEYYKKYKTEYEKCLED